MEIIGIVFGVVGVVGVIYTIYHSRRAQRKKLLVYEVSRSIALAQAFSPEDDYKLSVLFQRKGSIEEKIESVYTTFLKFANLGKEPIRGSDIAPANPLKVTVQGARILDIQVAGITREVNNVSLKNQVKEDEQAAAYVDFDFLDYRDGALIKILSVGNKGDISLEGDIIGMPEGIRDIEAIRPTSKTAGSISGLWALVIVIAGFLLSGYIFYLVIGSLRDVWLIFMPFGVLAIVVIISLIIDARPWLRGRASFPKSLDLPKWCRPLDYPASVMRTRLLAMEMQEAKTSKNEVKRKENKKGEN